MISYDDDDDDDDDDCGDVDVDNDNNVDDVFFFKRYNSLQLEFNY